MADRIVYRATPAAHGSVYACPLTDLRRPNRLVVDELGALLIAEALAGLLNLAAELRAAGMRRALIARLLLQELAADAD